MGKISFILGGARSGKSQYALKLAKETMSRKIAFIATCEPLDKEMAKRIAMHKNKRPAHWRTFEEPRDISLLLKKIRNKYELIILDCLTLLVSNLFLKNIKESVIKKEINKVLSLLKSDEAGLIIVSNEVGLGIVPENKLARDFRDVAGRINQVVAEKSDCVFFMVSGLSLKIK